MNGRIEVMGATILGFAEACANLKIIAGPVAENLVREIEVTEWYPFSTLAGIERTVIENYRNCGPIMERAGIAMMDHWHHHGPGKGIVRSAADFLRFQSGSRGYASVVKGPEHLVGSFRLLEMDEGKGMALVHSSTPFNRPLERGVLIGGMSAPGDLSYVDVDNTEDEDYFWIEFH